MNNTHVQVMRATAILWIIWGAVHIFFGVAIMATGASEGFAAIAASVPSEAITADYHPAIGAILNQHGWNLLWFGSTTLVGGAFIWKRSMTAIWVSAMIGGLADTGYLIFVDIGGYGSFLPGTLMTLIAGSATLLGGWVWFSQRKPAA